MRLRLSKWNEAMHVPPQRQPVLHGVETRWIRLVYNPLNWSA